MYFGGEGSRDGDERMFSSPHRATAHVNISFSYLVHCLSASYFGGEKVAATSYEKTLFITKRFFVSYTLPISVLYFDCVGIAMVTRNFPHHYI